MAKRRITQETFDAAVRENMEEFEMEPNEALKEAVEQFESQGKRQVTALEMQCSPSTAMTKTYGHNFNRGSKTHHQTVYK